MTEAEKLLREARKILLAHSVTRAMDKDFIQRVADYFRRQDKEMKK